MRPSIPSASPLNVFMAALLLLGFVQLSGAATIKAKAWLAPVLIERAWARSQSESALGFKPWAWADTFPVARLRVPSMDQNLMVLAGDSGNALAFGPGHTQGTARLGGRGVAVIGGHRDTHFAFLQHVAPGALMYLETVDGITRQYRIAGRRIVDSAQESLLLSDSVTSMLLVTCYPFDTLDAGGSLRYVVEAVPVKGSLNESVVSL